MSLDNALAVSKPRDHLQRFVRTPEQIELDHEAAMLRSDGKTFKQIADHFGLADPSGGYYMVQRAIEDIPREATVELIALELAKLDSLERRYHAIMDKHHVYVSASGRVVYDGDERLEDDAPLMKAMEGLLRVAARRAKLLGLDAPTRAELNGLVGVVVEDRSEAAKAAVWGLLTRLAHD